MSKDHSADALRQTFESALTANPDDQSAHMAYADWLTEQGDPRGEFIQVQLALEKADGPQRDQLLQREAALLDVYTAEWLGELAEPFLSRDDITFRFRRGWLHDIQVGRMRDDLAAQLAQAPEIRLLRRLAVVDPYQPTLDRGNAYGTHVLVGTAWFEEDEEVAMVPLLDSPYLGNVTAFQLGDAEHERCDVGDGPILGLLDRMPLLEEVRLFVWKLDDIEQIFARAWPHLRVLQVGGVFRYPVDVLAENASLIRLEDLLLQSASPGGHSKLYHDECINLVHSPHLPALRHLRLPFVWYGDGVCEHIVESGLLGRLRTLELPYSAITDAGAAMLAATGDLTRLEVLDLTGNHLTEEGIEQLRATGINLAWQPQTSPEAEEAAPQEVEQAEGEVGGERLLDTLLGKLIEDCRSLIGAAPRSLSDADREACRLRLTPEVEPLFVESSDPLLQVLRDQEILLERGEVVWGHLIQANSDLFDTDNEHTLPANIIYSLDPGFDSEVLELGNIAQELFSLKNSDVEDEELREFAEAITNEQERILRRELPASLGDGRQVFFATCFIQPGHLPDNNLARPFFPLLVHESTAAVMILPSRYWPEDLVAVWRGYAG